MPDFCKHCNRPKGAPHHLFGVCDTVTLSNGRVVHRQRVETGGDLHDQLGDDLKIAFRHITPEMRSAAEKEKA